MEKKLMFKIIFEKSRRMSVILNIVEATPQLDQNFKPIKNLCRQLFNMYLSINEDSDKYF